MNETHEGARLITYRTGDSDRARTLQVVAIPDGGALIDGVPHFAALRIHDGMRIAIPARRVLRVESSADRRRK